MMSRKEANAYLAAILEALDAAGDNGAPEGHMYAAMMGRIDLTDFQGLMSIAEEVSLITRKSHLATITTKGRDMVAKIRA